MQRRTRLCVKIDFEISMGLTRKEGGMAKTTTCLVKGKVVGIAEAVTDRDLARARKAAPSEYKCVECNNPVRPHKSGGQAGAHFEHLERNRACRLRDIR